MSRTGACPSCGSPITFGVGSSRAVVCRFCNTLVVRQGQDFASIGKIAEVVPTGSRIALDATGKYFGERFRVVGRVQMEWTQGVWDEWYVAFPDARWAWLAEAGGRYYMTFAMPGAKAPPPETIGPGDAIELGRHGRFVVTDVKQARVVAAAGELPEEVPLEGTVQSVDLDGTEGAFATIDYGQAGDDPVVFVGRQVPLEDLGLSGGVRPEQLDAPKDADAIACGNCGAPVKSLVPGMTVRMVCASCGALVDLGQGAGRVAAVLSQERDDPPIPLGRKGKLRGVEVLVVGWMKRGCYVDSLHYPWEELLLYEPKTTAFSWLVRSEGHWSLARTISAAEVQVLGGEATYRDKRYKLFSSVVAEVEQVLGEFPWQVHVGEAAQIEDYIAPPEGLSLEENGAEQTWSHVEHLDREEVAEAFGQKLLARRPRRGVGAVQPWFFAAFLRGAALWMAGGVAAALVLALVFASRSQQVVAEHTFTTLDTAVVDPSDTAPQPATRQLTWVSEPFELPGRRALEVRVGSDVNNHWAWVDGALIQEDSGEASVFGLETAYYSGYDDGAWSEGSKKAEAEISAPPRGTYVVRADLQWDPMLREHPLVTLQVREAGASGGQLALVLLLVLSPLLLLVHRRSFEKQRWEESNTG